MTTYTIAEEIKEELVKEFVGMNHNGYSVGAQGRWYAVDTDGDQVLDAVMHAQENRPWNPWHDNAVAVPVEDCFDHDGNDFAWPNGVTEEDEEEEAAISWAWANLLDRVEGEDA